MRSLIERRVPTLKGCLVPWWWHSAICWIPVLAQDVIYLKRSLKSCIIVLTILFPTSFLISKWLKDLTLSKSAKRFNLREETQCLDISHIKMALRPGRNFRGHLDQTVYLAILQMTERKSRHLTELSTVLLWAQMELNLGPTKLSSFYIYILFLIFYT